ncbi:MAG TPA: hypothetical protein DIU15_17260 [Deltaproteobacteria bacterium]|nr:hypothetical protein [Deltaproteobacteria bacterium]HCP47793.1 hypothetical protein [Deltaproteobacteria bacterium]|tara:strand:- start:156 stop:740 length:585 start_codon:yes stop_codon:yes gene_type:complete
MVPAVPALVVAFLLGAWGCSSDGTLPPSLIEQEDARLAARPSAATTEPAASVPSARVQVGYEKRTGLHIDIPYLSRRKLSELPADVVQDQLGEQLRYEDLPENERQVVFERAEVWTYDGRIYRIRKDLEHLMDIPTALGTSGFPLDLGSPIESTAELRWNSTWNMRRIRLMKSREDERLYRVIDVAAFLPKEFF